MRIHSLSELKSSISKSILISFIVIFSLASLIEVFIYRMLLVKQESLSAQQISSINNLYQASLSQKLAIIASSSSFLDYINSGVLTRQQLLPDFIATISSLKDSSVVGMQVYDLNRQQLIGYGDKSGTYVTLKLCYLNNRLDSSNGDCKFQWTLYFSKNIFINELMNTNPTVTTCMSCKSLDIFDSDTFGTFNISKKSHLYVKLKLRDEYKNTGVYALQLIFILTLVSFMFWNRYKVRSIITYFIERPLGNLANRLSFNNNFEINTNVYNIKELNYLAEQIDKWKRSLEELERQKRNIEIANAAIQVAHDIRSPIATLNMITMDLTNIAESKRSLLRNASNRINDIANNLLLQYKNNDGDISDKNAYSTVESEHIASLLDSIISEKRALYKNSFIHIELNIDKCAHDIFCQLEKVNFDRMMSNIINNSVEAITSDGIITVSLKKDINTFRIEIKDNGRGINEDILNKLLIGEFVIKYNGFGLGLKHAITSIKSWGGEYKIESQVNVGTNFIICLPLCKPSDWFAETLMLLDNSTIVILDDDNFIHEIWEKRFAHISRRKCTLSIHHFYTSEELVTFQEVTTDVPIIYLIDYELINDAQNGFELIQSLSINKYAYLVTNRYDDLSIRSSAMQQKIKIIPKYFAEHIKINLIYSQPNLIYIDDNEQLTDAWRSRSEIIGREIATFNSIDIFLRFAYYFCKNVAIYIDSDLGSVIKGENFAKQLYEDGFTEIYLTTGYPKSRFNECFWVKDIVGKIPPF